MPVVKDLLVKEIQDRIQQQRFLLSGMTDLETRLTQSIEAAEKNFDALNELLDALELECDHLERASA